MRALALGTIAFIGGTAFAATSTSVADVYAGKTTPTAVSTAPASLQQPTFGSWKVQEQWSLSAVHSEEKEILSESTRADVAGSVELSKNFDGQLLILARPAFRFVTGRDQDVFADRLPKDKIYADEAKLRWTPLEGTMLGGSLLEAGALNQSLLANSLLVDSRPFPAARAQVGLTPTSSTKVKVDAQAAIPSSYTLEDQATDNEPLPNLQTYSAVLEQLVSNSASIELGATYFNYDNLPQIVAVESKKLGNSVDIFSSSTGKFLYNYQGIALHAQVDVSLGSWDLGWKGQGIRNTDAPSDMGTGYVSTLNAKHPFGSTHEGGLTFSYYRVQPDTAPAMYTDAIFGNNRIGAGASAFVNHLRWGLQFKASYFQDTPYYANDLMGDRNLFLISVGNLIDDQTTKR